MEEQIRSLNTMETRISMRRGTKIPNKRWATPKTHWSIPPIVTKNPK
jgi:hypothetical protein